MFCLSLLFAFRDVRPGLLGVLGPTASLLLLFAFCTFLPSLLQQMGTNSRQKTQTMIMMGIMSLFMLWLGWGSPTGVLLFWATSSVFGVLQQVISTKVMSIRTKKSKLKRLRLSPWKSTWFARKRSPALTRRASNATSHIFCRLLPFVVLPRREI